MIRIALLSAAGFACTLAGCGKDFYRIETTIRDDGTVERAIYQPVATVSDEIQSADYWERSLTTDEIVDADWTGSIRDVRIRTPTSDDDHYYAAWAEFASVAEIPDHVVFTTDDESASGHLERRYETRDLGFVVEHIWTETLTDIVKLDEIPEACDKLSLFVCDLLEATLREGLGEEFDAAELMEWLRSDGRVWFRQSVLVYVEFMSRSQVPSQEPDEAIAAHFSRRLAEVAERYGLKVLNDDGSLPNDTQFETRVKDFATRMLREKVRTIGGDAPTDADIPRLLAYTLPFIIDDDEHKPLREQAEQVGQRVIEREFGGREKFEHEFGAKATRVFGIYSIPLLAAPRHFRCELSMPGVVSESNGKVLSPTSVRWQFDASDAYPFGFEMKCLSLTRHPKLTTDLTPGVPLDDLKSLTLLTDIAHRRPGLVDVMKKCVQQQTMQPLLDYPEESSPDAEQLSDYERVLGLLKLERDE